MFFPEIIKSIHPNDLVLEIGPGSTPFPRSNVLLEKKYSDEQEYKAQIGYTKGLKTNKQTIYYDGLKFPFKDKEFDYVICSHVLEHIENPDIFVSEITRVGKKGYFEFPTIYYDYLYDFPVHLTFLLYKDGSINWMPKSDSQLKAFANVTVFFYNTLQKRYNTLLSDLSPYFFQGFEWFDGIKTQKVSRLSDVCFDVSIEIPPKKHGVFPLLSQLFKEIANKTYKKCLN